MATQTPAQKLALEYGTDLRSLTGINGQLVNLHSRGVLTAGQCTRIQKELADAVTDRKRRYELEKLKLAKPE